MADTWYFKRPELAKRYSDMLCDPLFSRLALIGSRRIGKTTFLLRELAPTLEKKKCIPVYISMWADRAAPHAEFAAKLRSVIDALSEGSAISSVFNAEVRKVSVGNNILGKMDIEFKNEKASSEELSNIRTLLVTLVEKAKNKRVVLLLDEIQHLVTDNAFLDFQYSLRTVLDELHDQISVLYTGSSRAGMNVLFNSKDLPFYHSAQPSEFPKLEDRFVNFCIDKLKNDYGLNYDISIMSVFWVQVDRSPYWLIQLVRLLVMEKCDLEEGIVSLRRIMANEGGFTVLLRKLTLIEQLVLLRMDENASIYASEAVEYYKSYGLKQLSRSNIQTAINKLKTKKILTLMPTGEYIMEEAGLVDFIQRDLAEKKKL